jgi:glutamine synthetase
MTKRVPELEKIINHKRIEFIRLEQTDIHGIARSKTILSKYIRKLAKVGHSISPMLSTDPAFNDVKGAGYLEEMDFGDFVNFPDLSTFHVLPWVENTARIFVEPVQGDGTPVPAHPRWLAKLQLHKLEELGLQFSSSFEHEFFVMHNDGTPINSTNGARSTLRNSQLPKLFHQILREIPGDVYSFESESGPGQYEISCNPAWGIEGADEAFAFRTGTKEIAQQQGYIITFMTRPYPNGSGSSAHYNYSVWDSRGSRNMLYDSSKPKNLSDLGEHWVSAVSCFFLIPYS